MPEDDTQRATVEIQRLIEETRKFVAEQHKLLAEQYKLTAEGHKLNYDRWLPPTLAIASMIGGLLGAATFIATIIHG